LPPIGKAPHFTLCTVLGEFRRLDDPKSVMEGQVPTVVEVLVERVPKEREEKATPVFRPVAPAIWKAAGRKRLKIPS
jgi:hypothetical protein